MLDGFILLLRAPHGDDSTYPEREYQPEEIDAEQPNQPDRPRASLSGTLVASLLGGRLCGAFGVIGKVTMMTLRGEGAPSIRAVLLCEVLEFVGRARNCPGVTRISLVGSLTTEKLNPKDADVLVIVDDGADLTPLAAAGRRLKGRAQSHNAGADIFLANPSGKYIGRTCHWRECWFGKRVSCDAQHCGRRHFLHDDLRVIKLDSAIVKNPPIDLWPMVVRRVQVPADVEEVLLRRLEVQEHTQ